MRHGNIAGCRGPKISHQHGAAIYNWLRASLGGNSIKTHNIEPAQEKFLSTYFHPTIQKDQIMAYKCFVGNVSFNATESQLFGLFSQAGRVTSAKIVMDRETGRSRGFAFVEMSSQDEVETAIADLNGVQLDGRAIEVKVAQDKPRENRGGNGGGYGNGGGNSRGPRQNSNW